MGHNDDKWLDRNCWTNKSRLYRYFVLVNLCVLGFGEFVAYDSLGAFQEAITDSMNLTAQNFSYLYSIGSWPSVVLCFFGGFFVDKVFGIKVGTIIYAFVCLLGHFIFSLGVLINDFWCALIGRFFLGAGIELIIICIMYYAVIYFRGKELSMVQCLSVTLSRLGSSAVFELAYPLLSAVRQFYTGDKDIGITVFVVGIFTVASMISALILAFMNPKKEESLESNNKNQDEIKLSDILHFGVKFWLAAIASCAMCNNIYITIPFSQGFFNTRHGMPIEDANTVSSAFSLMGAASALVIGIVVDRVGREMSFVVLGFIIAVVSHLILAFTFITPYFSMFLLALSYSILTASLYPLYAYIVQEKMLGTAYGVSLTLVNLAFSVAIVIAGTIVDDYGYQALEIFVFGNEFIGLIAAVALWFYNFKRNGKLNWRASQRRDVYIKDEQLSDVTQPLKEEAIQ